MTATAREGMGSVLLDVAKMPVRMDPTMPPIPWSLNTSMPSSIPSHESTFSMSAQHAAVMKPITTAIHGCTYPAAGVMPTSPAMAPSQAPTTLNRCLCLM